MIRPSALSNPARYGQTPTQNQGPLPISNFHTNLALMRNPLMAAILQSIQQQQQQEQVKAQILQTLGFGANPNPMGMIPRGHGITVLDGKAMTRPGGIPPEIQALMESLLGLKQNPYIKSFGTPDPTGTFQYERPGGVGGEPQAPKQQEQVAPTTPLIDPISLALILKQSMQPPPPQPKDPLEGLPELIPINPTPWGPRPTLKNGTWTNY